MCYTKRSNLISLSLLPIAANLPLLKPAVPSTAPDTPTPQRGSSCGLWTVHSTKSLKTMILIFLFLLRGLTFSPSNAELNPICHLLVLLGAHHIPHVSRIRLKRRVKSHLPSAGIIRSSPYSPR